MRIQVGIHENVILDKVIISDKGRLVLFLRQLGENTEKKDENPFESMNASEVVEKPSDTGITFWPFKVPDEKAKGGEVRTEQERADAATGDVMQLKNQLQQILEQYMTKDSIKWSVWDGTGMTKETYAQDIISENVLAIVYKNLCEQFMANFQPYMGQDQYPMRFKLARQSKEKHYARVPGMFIKDNPFIEPMSVPKDQSRVKWTPYELKEGLNDGTPVSRETADEVEEPAEGENAFGSR